MNQLQLLVFFEEFSELLETLVATKDKFLIAGDINIHCDVTNDRHTIQLNDILSMFNLIQVIDSPTHRGGHTLDVVITRSEEINITGIQVSDISLSDHFLLSFLVDCRTLKSYYKTITYRSIKQVNKEEFRRELTNIIDSIPMEACLGKVVTE